MFVYFFIFFYSHSASLSVSLSTHSLKLSSLCLTFSQNFLKLSPLYFTATDPTRSSTSPPPKLDVTDPPTDPLSQTPKPPINLRPTQPICLRRSLFLRILSKVEVREPYFTEKRNNAKKLGLSPLQKMTATLKMLAYGVTIYFLDEYVRIAESIAMMSLKKFVAAVVAIFSEQYLRSPNNEYIAKLLAHGQNCGFPGMLGSIDCMHWKWKKRNDMSTTILQQILSGRLLLVVIVGLKK